MSSVQNVIPWQSALWHHVPLLVLRCKLFRVSISTGQELWPSHNVYCNALPVTLHYISHIEHCTLRTFMERSTLIWVTVQTHQYLCICLWTQSEKHNVLNIAHWPANFPPALADQHWRQIRKVSVVRLCHRVANKGGLHVKHFVYLYLYVRSGFAKVCYMRNTLWSSLSNRGSISPFALRHELQR